MKKFKFFLPTILAGILIGTSYIPFPPWAILFAFVPLWIFSIGASTYKQVFWGAWITQFILTLIGFHWVAYTAHEFGHLPWVLSLLALLAFAAFCHLQFVFAPLLAKFLQRRFQIVSPLTLALLYAASFLSLDIVWPMVFRWNTGYTWLWAKLPGAQAADLFGFEGLHFLTLIINAFFCALWLERKNRLQFRKHFFSGLTLFILINLLGWVRESFADPREVVTKKALVIQGNIGNLEKAEAEHGKKSLEHIFNVYERLTLAGLQKNPQVDYVIWPETAYPELLDDPKRMLNQRLHNFLSENRTNFLMGAYSVDYEKEEIYNALFILNGGLSQNDQRYRKNILLAFGESFPPAEWFPVLKPLIKKYLPFISSFGRGPGPQAFTTANSRVGIQVCYEGLFPPFSAQLKRQKAQWFLNVTNDSWFGYPFEPLQHLTMTAARAVESRVPLLRATNTGITALIDMKGNVLAPGPRNTEWYGVYDIEMPAISKLTWADRVASIWWLIPWLFLFALTGLNYDRPQKH